MRTVFNYLTDLEFNNNRPWFHAHKQEYKETASIFEGFVFEWNLRLHEMEESIPLFDPKKLMFRIPRDARYSHGKEPYNPSFRAHIAPRGKLMLPTGYFICIKPGERSHISAGLFPSYIKEATERMRFAILEREQDWLQIVNTPAFREELQLCGDALKNIPRGFDKNHPMGAYLKFKSWYVERPIPDAVLLDRAQCMEEVMRVCRLMHPFVTFINQTLEGVALPEE